MINLKQNNLVKAIACSALALSMGVGIQTAASALTLKWTSPSGMEQSFEVDDAKFAEFLVSMGFVETSTPSSVAAAATPEPLTVLGLATAAGFGAFFKKQKNKKHNQQQ